MADVLALHGSPGSGKSTLARALALALAEGDVPWGVIDLDELSLIHPYPGRFFPRENLRVLWPNYICGGGSTSTTPGPTTSASGTSR